MDMRAKCVTCDSVVNKMDTPFPGSSCMCDFLLLYLFLCFILGPCGFAILLAKGFLLFVIQQGVVLMVAYNLVLIVLQQLSQDGILQKMTKRKNKKKVNVFKSALERREKGHKRIYRRMSQ